MSSFKMPDVQVGQIVLWYHSADLEHDPSPGIVVGVGTNNIAVHVIDAVMHVFTPKDGVRHVKDPEARRPELADMGGWEHLSEAHARAKPSPNKLAPVAVG